eukprot:65351_1
MVKTTEYPTSEEEFLAYTTLVPCILGSAITIFHTTKIYSDFCTSERKALDHRRTKPPISAGYKKMAYLTYLSILFLSIAVLVATIEYNFAAGTNCRDAGMFIAQLLDKFFYFSSKCFLYLVLILRLHEVYGTSAYGYNKNTLICCAVYIIFMSIFLFVFMEVLVATVGLYADDTDDSYPWSCHILPADPYVTIISGVMSLVDVVANITAIIFFIIPLNKVVRACAAYNEDKEHQTPQKTKRFKKMLYTGYKYKVLVLVAALTTLLWVMLFVVGLNSFGAIVANLDFVINPLCLVLMTPYYPSDKYYEKLCYLCICCCDKNKESY